MSKHNEQLSFDFDDPMTTLLNTGDLPEKRACLNNAAAHIARELVQAYVFASVAEFKTLLLTEMSDLMTRRRSAALAGILSLVVDDKDNGDLFDDDDDDGELYTLPLRHGTKMALLYLHNNDLRFPFFKENPVASPCEEKEAEYRDADDDTLKQFCDGFIYNSMTKCIEHLWFETAPFTRSEASMEYMSYEHCLALQTAGDTVNLMLADELSRRAAQHKG